MPEKNSDQNKPQRDCSHMKRMVVGLLLISVVMLGCLQQSNTATATPSGNNADGNIEVQLEHLPLVYQTTNSTYVFSDQKEWDDFLNRVPSEYKNPNSQLDVDFSQYTVLAVFSWQKNSGGYATNILKVKEWPEVIIAFVQEISPGNYCTTTSALTEPGDIVKIKKTDKPVQFVFEKLATICKPWPS